MAHMNAVNSSSRNPTPTREILDKCFRETQDIFDKLFKALFGVISFKSTATGEALFIAHPNVMMVMVLMIVLYFSLWLLGTILPQHRGILQLVLLLIMIVIASVFSVLVMTIISSLSLLDCLTITFIPWGAVFALTAYCCYQELYNLVGLAISDTINQLIHHYRIHSTRVPV
ncbi:uncharacterized protein LOC109805724 [Cajanus cajan]|uniref:Uncharacterized protein n=1 Tax=Cajanus cajan TaxID=3821 RepID=A0A151SVK5_CAJCA|nr:uncharacterized protein LOC109805724 [Cajanus cajan]KYP58830.1 hypothetical protein KK1_014252 [Cajanus cajan]